jgi:uncharacterized protein
MKDIVCVVMAKQPQVGWTKTRLSPPLTLVQAAVLYEALLLDTIALVSSLPLTLALVISPPGSHAYFSSITPPHTLLLPIEGKDIGVCLSQAFQCLLGMGWKKVFALNADGPSLPPDYLLQAVKLLGDREIVLGPAQDGGYYLIGMQRPHLGLFQGITWSTGQVFVQTLARAQALGLSVGMISEWSDVDTNAELQQLRNDLNSLPSDRLVHTRKLFAQWGELVF